MKMTNNRQSVQTSASRPLSGFTIVEMILVLVILSIAAMLAIPFAASGASSQLKSAATIISSDLEYAKSMAISRGRLYRVAFDTDAESYSIEDANGVISNPVTNHPYTVNFGADTRLDRVDILSVDFDSVASDTITFDYLGSPYSGVGTGAPLNSGVITLSANGSTMRVSVEPVTGYIRISD